MAHGVQKKYPTKATRFHAASTSMFETKQVVTKKRKKPKGWRGDRARHSMAARGIKTRMVPKYVCSRCGTTYKKYRPLCHVCGSHLQQKK